MNLVASMKECQKCRETKALAGFARHSRYEDGLQKWCRSCQAAYQRENRDGANARLRRWRKNHPEEANRLHREERWNAIFHYAAGEPRCACCGESEPAFLVLDHVNGGGNAERRIYGRNFYRSLRLRDYPSGFQVLCWNCNAAKQYQGMCPHERARREATA